MRDITAHLRQVHAIVCASSALENCSIANDRKFVIDGLSARIVKEWSRLPQFTPIRNGIVMRTFEL